MSRICLHIANQVRTPAVERAAEHEQLVAEQYIGKRIEWDPDDGYGVRRGVVVGWSRWDEGYSRVGGLILNAQRTDGRESGFSFPFQNEDAWKVIE